MFGKFCQEYSLADFT